MNRYPMPEQYTDERQAGILHSFQQSEITEYHIYTRIAAITPEAGNRDVLLRIASEELQVAAARTVNAYTSCEGIPGVPAIAPDGDVAAGT